MNLSKFKPGVNRSFHLFTASLLWSIIGIMLMFKGYHFAQPDKVAVLLPVAFAIGTIKSLVILDRSFKTNIQRILGLEDGTCLGAVYPWRLWLLAGVMICLGFLLRALSVKGSIPAVLYMAIGWALVFSSRNGWLAWQREL